METWMETTQTFSYYHEDGTKELLHLDPRLSSPNVDPKKRPYKFSPMPADATAGDRFYFLGWPISWDELKALGTRRNPRCRSGPLQAVAGCDYLRVASGFRFLQTATVEPQTEEEKNAPENKDGLTLLMLWVNEAELFHRIPNQGQVDKLVEILKREPAWYRDMYETDEFDRHHIH
ncbi:hypothetical protein GALMADRAFT_399463 [Galerina marginata CBS 339.88]|uniref:Uncharacterized protein n=1 Tax=Galerina marginata (strain CBS 339.88) TaxID=685588 RepID=A0A067TS97_GALM3|nr:hypothetical protein GALMADRAFT_399463 [Galerina marginata CBS 339.88]